MTRVFRRILLVVGVLALVFLAACGTTKTAVEIKQLAPNDAYALLQSKANDPNFVILDVRTPQEFQAGHIRGAVNIDFYAPDFQKQLDQLDKTKTYFVYCRTGHRSGQAVQIMKQLGFQHIYELRGGIMNWLQAGLPVISGQ